MATNMLGTLLEAALFLEEHEGSYSQSDFSSSSPTTTTSSTASSPSTSSPTILQRAPSGGAPGRHSSSPTTAPAWTVKMSAGSPTIVMPGAGSASGLSPQTAVHHSNSVVGGGSSNSNGRPRTTVVDANGAQVVSTNQSQYPTAKAVSLSVANLPQQTAAIPLIIGQQQHHQLPSGGGVSISASPAYGYAAHHHQQQHQPTATLLSSINQAAVLSGNGFQLTTTAGSSGSGASVVGGPGSAPAITAGITRIVDSSGNILHLPSGTAAAAVNSGSGTTFSTLVRVNGNGSVDPEEQFDNDSLPPSLVVISPQNFAAAHNSQSAVHHGQTISIIPGPAPQMGGGGGRDMGTTAATTASSSTGLDLSHVEFLHSSANGSAAALSSNQKSLEVTTTTTTSAGAGSRGGKKILVNQPVFLNRPAAAAAAAYPGIMDHQQQKTGTGAEGSSGDSESIMKSTNMVSGKMQHPQQPLFANGLLGAAALHFQHTMPVSSTATDKPEDLSSHLTLSATTLAATGNNGYGPLPTSSSASSVGGETVNNILSKTTGTTTTLVGTAPKPPVLNLRDLSIDPQQLQLQQQQQSIYDIVYQKGVMTAQAGVGGVSGLGGAGVTAATATATGRRRTISNNSTGGSQRSPSSMRSGTRESHNKLEKNRRAQMRNCFEQLKKELPKGQEEKKTSNLSILSSALNFITTQKRTDKEQEHELGRLVKVKIELQNKLASLKREMASQLDKDPALAALVAGCEIQRSARTSESGADEASSMDGYPSNGDETDSFRERRSSSSLVERSLSPHRNRSPLVISGPVNGGKLHMLGDQVSLELKQRSGLSAVDHLSAVSSATTILAVPNLSQISLTTSVAGATQLPLTAINLSATAANNNNHVPNGVLNIPIPCPSSGQQIFTSVAAPTTSFVSSNGPSQVIAKSSSSSSSNNINGFNKNINNSSSSSNSNGLIIKETISGTTTMEKVMMFNGVNGVGGAAMTSDSMSTQAMLHPHTQVHPIYSSTQSGGLRVIGHHTKTTTSTGSNGSMPTSVVFSDPSAKYQQHLPSGMVISAPLGGMLPANLSTHPYLTNASATGAAPLHKLLLTTSMGGNLMAQSVSAGPGGYSLPHMTSASDMFSRSGTTSLPGGAQLNLCRSPSSTPSPTISFSAASVHSGPAAKGNGAQKGGAGRGGTQISSLPTMTSNGTLNMTLPVSGATSNGKQIVAKEGPPPQMWGSTSASPHSFMPYQMIAPPALPIVSVATGNNGNGNGNGKAMSMETVKAAAKGKRASNGPGSRGGKRKNNNAAVMITPQTSMEPVKSGMGVEITSKAAGGIGTGSGGGGASITLTNSKPATIK